MRAQRSKPESLCGGSLDCFVARAPRNDGARVKASFAPSHLHRRHAFAAPRLISPELCFDISPSEMKEGAGKTGSPQAPEVHCAESAW
ncbi:hypothetical protein XH96_14200 [Bradyrhizobium sp. CCBAU 51765]|nr:hypothetical protein XH96_14200 [Bradyrhizobium sp. CCBAU 51765]